MLAKRRIKNYNSDYREQFEKMRGGSWHNASQSGLFALNLNNPRSAGNDNIGFRSALACYSYDSPWTIHCNRTKGNCFRPSLFGDRLKKMRGGAWQNSAGAGLFNLNLNNSRSLATNDIGFRSALDCSSFIGVYGQGIAVITKESISIPAREKID